MKTYSIIGYTYDADVYCTDCAHEDRMDKDGAEDSEGNPVHPIFISDASDTVGYSCGKCHAFLGPDLEWHTDVKDFRWARCCNCEHQEPFVNSSENRLLARQFRLCCNNCYSGTMRFESTTQRTGGKF